MNVRATRRPSAPPRRPRSRAAGISIADEVWIATALLHRERPTEKDFPIQDILERLRREGVAGKLRPGVYPHIVQHCVANRPPSPAHHRILFESRPGFRRLFRYPDAYHPGREHGKVLPELDAVPSRYHTLLQWYQREYQPSVEDLLRSDSILELEGAGKGLWADEDPDEYVRRLREGWE